MAPACIPGTGEVEADRPKDSLISVVSPRTSTAIRKIVLQIK